jgi:hypothetical protein
MPLGISFFIPPLRHFVTPLLKERLLSTIIFFVGAIIGRPFSNFTRAANDRPYDYFYSTKKGIIVDNPF